MAPKSNILTAVLPSLTPTHIHSNLSTLDVACQHIGRAARAIISKAKPETVISPTDNEPSSVVACIFNMAKRAISVVAKGPPVVNASMKILHALLVVVAKAVGMRIKQACEYVRVCPGLTSMTVSALLLAFYIRTCILYLHMFFQARSSKSQKRVAAMC